MTIRLLHTADWQLGKPFSRFGDADVGALLRDARFDAVATLARLASAENVDAVVVAGDVVDNEHADPRVLRLMVARMRDFDGPWLILPGNHDPARPGGLWDRFEASGDRPPWLTVLHERKPLELANGQLLLLPAPLVQKHSASDPTEWFDGVNQGAGAVTVGLAHGSVADLLPEAADNANPIARDRPERAGLDYLALGDWHSVKQIGARCWYCGTPEPDSFTQSGMGEALLVTIEGPRAPPVVERRRTGKYRWLRRQLDLSSQADAIAVVDLIKALVESVEEPDATVLELEAIGHLDLAARATLDRELERSAASFRHLEVDIDHLETVPSDADLADFVAEPVTMEVADQLRSKGGPVAALALRLLHAEWQRLGQR